MRLVGPSGWRQHPMMVAIAAILCAATLVLYLQHRAIAALESQTRVVLQQMSELTASDIAVAVRQMLEGPVFETLTAVNHPELRSGRLDLVAEEYEQALTAYPHIDRFFVWHALTEAEAPGEVLFYGRGSARGRFDHDSQLGRAIVSVAERYRPEQHIYVAAEPVGPSGHQVFLRMFWTDAGRTRYFALLGFVLEPDRFGRTLFSALHARSIEPLLRKRGGDVPLQLRVTDERGRVVHGSPDLRPITARVVVPMAFYPLDRIASRLSGGIEWRAWTLEVSAADAEAALGGISRSYWPTLLSVLLMFVALALTIQAQRRATELASMQADFIAHASHQLKTPLSLLSAATETLEMARVRSPEKMAEYLSIIRGEVAQLSALVQRVLEFSRLQQRRSYEFETVDLGALVRETVDAFSASLATQQFVFDVQQDVAPLHVRADPAALEQVLANLLDNAVKYSDTNRRVTVRVREEDGAALVEVADRGVGIDRSEHARIFERFYRAASAGSRPGFGLGLPIVHEIVRAHGGQIQVHSAPGTGSTFRVTLPRARGAEVPDRQTADGLREAAR